MTQLVRRLAAISAGLLVLMVVLLLLTPWLINTGAIEQKVRGVIAERTSRSVTYGTLSISFFPRPHLTIDAFRLSLPGTASADIASLQVYPEILPLFTGTIRLSKVTMDRPEVTVDLASLTRTKGKQPRRGTSHRQEIEAALTELRTFASKLLWQLTKGKFVLQRSADETLILSDLRGRFHLVEKGLDLEMSGSIDRWGKVSARGRLQFEQETALSFSGVNIVSGGSSVSGLSARFNRTKDWQCAVRLEQATLRIEELYRQATAIGILPGGLTESEPPSGTITLSGSSYAGPLLRPAKGRLDLRGAVTDLSVRPPSLPEPAHITRGRFTASMDRFSFTDVRLEALDSTAAVTASGTLALPSVPSADITLDGTIGPRTMAWLAATFSLHPGVTVRTPLSLTHVSIGREQDGTISIAGEVAVQDGPTVKLQMNRSAHELAVERLDIADGNSSATLSFRHRPGLLDILFSGRLAGPTLDRLFVQSAYNFGSIDGDIEAHLDLAHPQASRFRGFLQADRIIISGLLPAPIDVRHAALHAEQDRIIVEAADLAVDGQEVSLAGTAALAEDRFRFDADLRSQSLAVDRMIALFRPAQQDGGAAPAAPRNKSKRPPAFSGSLRWDIGRATYGTFAVEPLSATIRLTRDRVGIQFTRAVYCGIGLTGSLTGSGKDLALRVNSRTSGLDLEPTLACVAGKDLEISGKVDLAADLTAHSPPSGLLDDLGGTITINARDGQILKATIMTRLLALLNVTDIVKGEYTGKEKGGIRYRILAVKTELERRSLRINELVMDSEVMDLTGNGSVSLADRTLDMTMLVAPIKVGNWLVKKIPLVRDILDGKLVTIAVKATGSINDPKVTVLPSSAVGEGLVGIAKRTLQLPFKIIEPVIKSGNQQDQ